MKEFFDWMSLLLILAIIATLVASTQTKSILSTLVHGTSGLITAAKGY